MLILTRKLGERIIIGDNIIVSVLSIHRGIVRLGIEGPIEVPIVREELFLRDRYKNNKQTKEI